MNYEKIYDQIIQRRKINILQSDVYSEKHHILPKCLGGGNEKENIVKLTAREHFICHWLLCRIYPSNRKLSSAFWFICNARSKGQERYTPPSRSYQEAKERHAFALSLRKDSSDTRRLKSVNNARKGKPNWNSGIKYKLKIKTEAQKQEIKNKTKASKIKNGTIKPVIQLDLQGNFIAEFESIGEAKYATGAFDIWKVCKNKRATSGGFKWRYK